MLGGMGERGMCSKQRKAEQTKAEQRKAEQRKARSRVKQSREEQSRAELAAGTTLGHQPGARGRERSDNPCTPRTMSIVGESPTGPQKKVAVTVTCIISYDISTMRQRYVCIYELCYLYHSRCGCTDAKKKKLQV